MRKEKRVIAMDGDDQIAIVVGQNQMGQFLDRIESTRSSNQGAIGICETDLADGFGVNGVHDIARDRARPTSG